MTVTSEATTVWGGDLMGGSGSVALMSSGLASFVVNWNTRSTDSTSTVTPEELLAAAHSSCFCMAFANELTAHGTPPESIETTASVTFKPGTGITGSHLNVNATVPGITPEDFQRIAESAKSGCPVSKALAGIELTIEATLA